MLEERNRTPDREKSIAELTADLSGEVRRLISDEFRIAVAELQAKGKRLGLGVGMAGAAGLLALFGGAALLAAAVLALALVLPAWLAALLVGAALMLVAGCAALLGKKEAQRAIPPVPEEAAEGVREDLGAINREVRS